MALIEEQKGRININIGYSKLTGALFLSVAVLNTLAYFIAGPYPSLRMLLMAIFAAMGICYLTRTAYSVDIANKEITFYSLLGPLKRKVKYTSLASEGNNIYCIAEKNGKREKLTYLGVSKKDAQALREYLSNP